MKELVIFDLDGVLLDSEKLYMEMNSKFFKELGADISKEEQRGFVGISATKMWEYIREKAGLTQSVEQLKEMERELKHKTLREAGLVPSEGVLVFLERLKARKSRLAIASSGLRKNVDLILSKLGVGGYFDLIVSGEDVLKGKLGPDIFLKTSAYFGRRPDECAVIEDSANGVKAAKAAGMLCLGYSNPTSGDQDLSQADLVFDHFGDPRLHGVFGLKEVASQ